MGRPANRRSVYDDEAIDNLCRMLVHGMSMKQACRISKCPSDTAVYERMAVDEEFRARIARAKVAQQDAIMDDIQDMADAATPENWQVVKLQIWTRQWRAAKLAPKVYGDKVDVTHAGEIGVRNLTDVQLADRLAEFGRKAGTRSDPVGDEPAEDPE